MATKFSQLKKSVVTLAIVLAATAGAQAQLNWSGTQTLTAGQVITQNITLTGNVTISVPSGTATISGIISGNYSVTITGAGTLVYTADNTYTGTTTINAGSTLALGVYTDAAGKGNVAGDIVNNGGLNFDHSNDFIIKAVISGTGTVYKSNTSSKVTLTGYNTYTGLTTLHGGTLQIGDGTNGAVIGSAVNMINASTATLYFMPGWYTVFDKVISGNGSVHYTGATGKELTLSGNNTYTGTTTLDAGGSVQIAGSTPTGNIINNGYLIFNYGNNDKTYAGVISGTGELAKWGAGKLTLTGINTYTGATGLYGTLQIGNGTSGSIANTSNVTLADANAILRFEPGSDMVFDKVISGSGSVQFKGNAGGYFGKSLSFSADNTYTGTTTIEQGVFQIGANTTTGAVKGNIILNTEGILHFGRSNTYTYSGVISGSGYYIAANIWFNGSTGYFSNGTVILTGANTYTPETRIYSGKLQIGDGTSGSIAGTSNVSFPDAAILRFEPGTNMTFDKVISGPGSVEYKGSTSKALYFTADNTYTGTTTIDGDLVLGDYTTAGSVAGDIIINSGFLDFYRSNTITYPGVISGTGDIFVNFFSTAGNVILTGVNTYTGITYIYSGTLQIGTSGSIANSAQVLLRSVDSKFDISPANQTIKALGSSYTNSEVVLGAKTLTIGATGQTADNGAFAGYFSGTGGVTKQGTGTFTMSSVVNTATGTFTQNAGEVILSGKWAGNYSKATGAALTVTGNPVIGGGLSLAGGDINMDLTAATPSKLSVTGAVSASGTNTLNVTASSAVTNYTMMEAASGITSTTPYALNIPGMSGTLSVQNPTKLLLNAVPTAIDDVLADNLKIYPNPVKDYLRFTIYDLRINKVEILDLSGKTIVNIKSSIVNQINVANLPSGVYFLKIETDSGIVTKKFVKE